MPTPPGPAPPPGAAGAIVSGTTPPIPRLPSPALSKAGSASGGAPASTAAATTNPAPVSHTQARRARRAAAAAAAPTVGGPDAGVPPISVLIVEDNAINLKVLETFMKKLRVRTHTAINGRIAVAKWRELGGVHLVLMDIRLPVMNGLDATKEIRRLERVNGVGVLADKVGSDAGGAEGKGDGEGEEERGKEEDRLARPELFKSPVIIVALTASNLQSDRDEALAAGCNDFLTKVRSLSTPSSRLFYFLCFSLSFFSFSFFLCICQIPG